MRDRNTVGRRAFLTAIGAAGVAGCSPQAMPTPTVTPTSAPPRPVFHQPGVVTPAQPYNTLVAFDVAARGRAELADVLRGLRTPAGIDMTVAAGASLFDGRFGLVRPKLLATMPPFPADTLDPQWCHGDLLIQIGADHPKRIEAVLSRHIPGLVVRWRVDAFRPPADSVRNLLGFREGAGNPDAADPALMDNLVWVQPADDEPAWCAGGSYQVVRLIKVALPAWNAQPVAAQERVFGRSKGTGAPLGQSVETAPIDFTADPNGSTIALDAHIRRANPHTPDTATHRILRRSYSYRLAQPDNAGQVFICFQRDVESGFVTIQRRLAGEALEKFTTPFGGGYYFVLPGSTMIGDDYVGKPMIDTAT
jgi:deferrochelatase/peroxidase EfeB